MLEHVRKTSTRGTLDVDLDRTYDEKLWIASIHLIRSAQHSMIDQVRQAPFDHVCEQRRGTDDPGAAS